MRSLGDWVQGALLAGGCSILLLSCAGLLIARDPLEALHRVAPAGVAGAPLVCLAVLVNEGWTPGGIHALIVGAILLVSTPLATHAIARSARLRETQGVLVLPSERPDEEGP